MTDEVGLWSQVLGLYLSVREGQLRYLSEDGELISNASGSRSSGVWALRLKPN